MTLQSIPGGRYPLFGPDPTIIGGNGIGVTTNTLNAANAASIYVGRILTSDGASHTIDTTGSSALGWRTDAVTFANAGTTCVVGLAPVDTANAQPARANNSTGTISFDVKASFTGGGGGVTTQAWQSSVPTSGSKTIANGDLVAFAIQTTARGGTDSIGINLAQTMAGTQIDRPAVTSTSNGTAFSARTAVPNCIITFSDGAIGWFEGSEVFSTENTRTWNSGSATKEYGQLYQFPFPMKIFGIYGIAGFSADCDLVLYSDPLGTPVAEKTASIVAKTVQQTAGSYFREIFAAPYSAAANQPFGVVFKPAASSVSAYYKTLAAAAHRAADMWGTSGYGISRASGAFANANSSLDHYYVGLLAGAFDGGGAAGGLKYNNDMGGNLG